MSSSDQVCISVEEADELATALKGEISTRRKTLLEFNASKRNTRNKSVVTMAEFGVLAFTQEVERLEKLYKRLTRNTEGPGGVR
jgi:hypothetical protein